MGPTIGEIAGLKRLVADANILLRAVLGVRVRTLLETYGDSTDFFAPEVCFDDARRLVKELAGLAADGRIGPSGRVRP